MITDSHGRSFKKLRISLTSGCNLACTYCVPQGSPVAKTSGLGLNAKQFAALVEKIHRINPLDSVRLTGGEPLLYRELPYLTEAIADMGIKVGMTTNALLLTKHIARLHQAGLCNVNISLDAADPAVFYRMTGSLKYLDVCQGIETVLRTGVSVKLNSVIIRDMNENQILPLLEYAGRKNIPVRFLELMAMGHLHSAHKNKIVKEEAILNCISRSYRISPFSRKPGATARYWETENHIRFGIISNHSQPFCSDCDRLRLDSRGNIYGCISAGKGYSITESTSDDISDKLKYALEQKQNTFTGSAMSMQYIGG